MDGKHKLDTIDYPHVDEEEQTTTTETSSIDFNTNHVSDQIEREKYQNSIFFSPEFTPPKLTENLKNGFMQKVFGIFSAQVFATYLIVAFLNAGGNFEPSPAMIVTSSVCTIVISIILFCCVDVSRRVPINYILLGIFTFCESYLTSVVVKEYNLELAEFTTLFLATCCTFALVGIYAYYTKTDYTSCYTFGIIMLSSIVVFFLLSIFGGFLLTNILIATGAFMFSCLYIAWDVQIICGGMHRRMREISKDDYIIAALILYIDFIQLLIDIIRILGKKDK